MSRWGRILLGTLVLAGALSMVQDPRFERFRARWDHLPTQERVAREERLRELMRLSPEERAALLERVRTMRAVEEEALQEAPKDLRRRLEEAGPWDRERLHHEYFERFARERGRDLREHLPPELCNPDRYRRGRGGPHRFPNPGPEVLRHLAERLGLSEAQVTEFEGLDGKARFGRLHRLHLGALVRERGLPPTLTKEGWEAMQALDDREFFKASRAHFPSPGRGGRGGPRGERGGPPRGEREGKPSPEEPRRDEGDPGRGMRRGPKRPGSTL